MTTRRVGVTAGVAAAVAWLAAGATALAAAGFVTSTSASQTLSTATLAAPGNPSTSRGTCLVGVSDTIVVSWTATTSTWADGYHVLRSTTSGGPYSVVATINGVGTTSYTDSGLAFSTTYHYVVRAWKGAWTSPLTAQVSRTTRTSLCLI